MLTPGDLAPVFDRRPVFGLPVQVPCSGPLVLLFVRSLSSPFTRETLTQMQARHGAFDLKGARVAAVSDSELELAQDYVPRHHMLFPLIVDPEQVLYEQWGVGGTSAVLGRLRGLAMAGVQGAVRALRHGHGRIERRQLRLPAQFVVRDGEVVFAHYGSHVAELPDLDALLAAIG